MVDLALREAVLRSIAVVLTAVGVAGPELVDDLVVHIVLPILVPQQLLAELQRPL